VPIISDGNPYDAIGIIPAKLDLYLVGIGIKTVPDEFNDGANGVRFVRKSLDVVGSSLYPDAHGSNPASPDRHKPLDRPRAEFIIHM